MTQKRLKTFDINNYIVITMRSVGLNLVNFIADCVFYFMNPSEQGGVDDLKNALVVEKYVCHFTAPRLLITVTYRRFYAEDKRIYIYKQYGLV